MAKQLDLTTIDDAALELELERRKQKAKEEALKKVQGNKDAVQTKLNEIKTLVDQIKQVDGDYRLLAPSWFDKAPVTISFSEDTKKKVLTSVTKPDMTKEEITTASGVSKNTVNGVLSQLVKEGKLEVDKRKTKNYYSLK